ncbi:bifunctional 4-hydroxy-2-oxoglutarate aldolase/2-dehydro-3-deoxy-phosphogluconate aldolase [Terribacillus saccharophilus]|uniref:Bifunctional 2-keto-4-hydroxyglutarate aldolase/2-keto-3-deoxy-6-phosphogluconate aldolase n=1 Tax=Terribacillus saccharophilus TaxID=361277 RepID=A0ABX4GW08_9BACI|nr:bifunctional 4-hydroxy-2-oxoglutarate aldolase/2-dehydro-3-deoxy-phosphogluconate aldolase [Terribacillus saccharophilus]PAD34707.1 bifunctional 2-keto-4-hydroxyglutarate aldolase/2-keto-3-deoxy-6-phosphogluconate aldolase [Terribacillus saccharophilus]PAD95455.1 bifunctional 2-keto-4-hydroxyglutarate aldolase/2-keto-3-deoxy-6-phosphogluconate aldolase [Terribacillus saccharophilus]PAD99033.1 bifunctional 2-keto-4-hydroxyglutarate aldolase/2-keto-3-deoxy-6-phosphogluconate aldolase [Terribaci
MKKAEVLAKLTDQAIVAVVRADSPEQAIQISDACIEGGLTGIEVTFTVKDADQVIKQLSAQYVESPDVVIGAGTVLDSTTARLAILAGASFIVSPTFDAETAKLCNLYQVPYLPGCMTIGEIKQAMEAGVDIIKLFPGSAFGPSYIKAVKAPLPQANIMPTGGVDLENVGDWLKNGAVAVGVGGNLVAPASTGDYDKITSIAQQYIQKVKEAKTDRVNI